MSQFKVTECFVQAKHPDAQCEDVVCDGRYWTVLVDGVSDKSGIDFDGCTGGFRVAEIVRDVVSTAPVDASACELVGAINARYLDVLGRCLTNVPAPDWPAATFVAVNKTTGDVVRVGDTSWRTERRSFRGHMAIDDLTCGARAALLRSLLIQGASLDDLRVTDPGREAILPILRTQSAFRNLADDSEPYAYGAIDGHNVPARFIETWHIEDDEHVVTLASDGYPTLELHLAEAERVLHDSIRRDPLRILGYAGTKAAPALPEASFDDRSFIRLERA